MGGKRIAAAGLIVLLVCWSLYELAAAPCMGWVAARWCRAAFSSELTYDALQIEGSHWTFFNPRLAKSAEADPWFAAATLQVAWGGRLHSAGLSLAPHISLDAPTILLPETEGSFDRVFHEITHYKVASWLAISPHMEFFDGELIFSPADGKKNYRFKGWGESSRKASLEFASEVGGEHIALSIDQEHPAGALKVSVVLERSDLHFLSRALHSALGRRVAFPFVEGQGDGKLELQIPATGDITVAGDIHCSQVCYRSLIGGPVVTANKVGLIFSGNSGLLSLPEGATLSLKPDSSELIVAPTQAVLGWDRESYSLELSNNISCARGSQPMCLRYQAAWAGLHRPAKATAAATATSLHLCGQAKAFGVLAAALFHRPLPGAWQNNNEELRLDLRFLSSGRSDLFLSGAFQLGDTAELPFQCELVSTSDGYEIARGGFSAKDLPLNSWVSPLIFQTGTAQISGHGDFEGVFDGAGALIHYTARELVIDHPDFFIEIPEIPNSDRGNDNEINPSAYHCFDFVSGLHKGVVPISQGVFQQKIRYNSSENPLIFSAINGQVAIENNGLHSEQLEAFCDGIFFSGDLTADFASIIPGEFSLEISCNTIHGRIAQFCRLLEGSVLPLPHDGIVTARGKGLQVCFDATAKGYDLYASLEGTLSDGKVGRLADLPAIEQISCDFTYDHSMRSLLLTDIQGTLLAGPDGSQEYLLAGDYISCENITKPKVSFDLWAGGQERDIIRLAGVASFADSGPLNEEYIFFQLDPKLSHLGSLYPERLEIALKDWMHIEKLQLSLPLELSTALEEVKSLQQLFPSFQLPLAFLSNGSLRGNCFLDFSFDAAKDLLRYSARGAELFWGDRVYRESFLTGEKRGRSWTIEQCILDELSLSADLTSNEEGIKINFLGARLGTDVLAGLEGQYNSSTRLLQAKINLLEADLAGPTMEKWFKFPIEAGHLEVQGDCSFRCDAILSSLSASLKASVLSLSLGSFHFKDIKGIHCRYTPDGLLSITGVSAPFSSGEAPPVAMEELYGHISLDELQYRTPCQVIAVQKARFSLPYAYLPPLAALINTISPGCLDNPLLAALAEGEGDKPLTGTFSGEIAKQHSFCALQLADGSYNIGEEVYRIKDFSLNYINKLLKISCLYLYQRPVYRGIFGEEELIVESAPYPLQVVITSTTGTAGRATVAPSSDVKGGDAGLMALQWRWNGKGLSIDSVEGSLQGITCRLERTAHELALTGSVAVDTGQAMALLPASMSKALACWQLGMRCFLRGTWQLDGAAAGRGKGLAFHGLATAQDLQVNGYLIEEGSAAIDYTPDRLVLREVLLRERQASAKVDLVTISRANSSDSPWTIAMQELSIKNLKPMALRTLTEPLPKKGSTILFKNLLLHDLQGTGLQSFTGHGTLLFSNQAKHVLKNTLLSIPKDLVNRFGVTQDMLTPESGVLHYHLEGGKIFFDGLEEVYSKRRLSQFYLPGKGESSYIDWDGGLHVQVRMKQYNVLFKFAELFTITVQGTLDKPSVSMSKDP